MIAAARIFVTLVAIVIGLFLGFFLGIWLCSVMVWEDPEVWREEDDQDAFRDWIQRAENGAIRTENGPPRASAPARDGKTTGRDEIRPRGAILVSRRTKTGG